MACPSLRVCLVWPSPARCGVVGHAQGGLCCWPTVWRTCRVRPTRAVELRSGRFASRELPPTLLDLSDDAL
eukprot:4158890-Pyramimonas_sp.AAC.1